jgi:hypothetical protein
MVNRYESMDQLLGKYLSVFSTDRCIGKDFNFVGENSDLRGRGQFTGFAGRVITGRLHGHSVFPVPENGFLILQYFCQFTSRHQTVLLRFLDQQVKLTLPAGRKLTGIVALNRISAEGSVDTPAGSTTVLTIIDPI